MIFKKEIFITFFKYNIVAAMATAVDFLVFYGLFEWMNLWYLMAAFFGPLSGGIVAFVLGRNWAFNKKERDISAQASKFLLVWVISMLLNILGIYIMVDYFVLDEIWSKIITSIIVGVGFNFFAQKYFIFK